MAAIKIANYQTIAQLYADASAQIAGVSDYYYDAAYEIVTLQVFDPELDLLGPFYNAYLAAQVVYVQVPQAVVTAVNTLQTHVIQKARTTAGARFNSINQWIDASGTNDPTLHDDVGRQGDSNASFTVPQRFANVSSQAGYAIVTNNIT